jgi:glycine C-acetyltransferase
MKPYQVNLFTDKSKIPDFLPSEPFFIYENKRYLNFLVSDCFHLKNNDYLKDAAKLNIESSGIAATDGRLKTMDELQNMMSSIKKVESLLLFPDEISAFFAIFSIFGPKTTFFVDYETTSSVIAILQYRNIEYYSHKDLEHLDKILSAKSEKVMIIDGVYEWLGNVSPANELIKVAENNESVIIANEMNSFGLLGREGRGFIDLFNLYDVVNIEVGSFSKFLGGFGCYIGAKKYLINKIKENITGISQPLPQFMLSVNLAGLEIVKTWKNKNSMFKKLWQNSRYFISRLKQIGFSTMSDTPIVVVSFNNNEEAGEFAKRLFFEQIIVAQNKERIRLCLSIEHSKEDLDYCLSKFESIGRELGVIK